MTTPEDKTFESLVFEDSKTAPDGDPFEWIARLAGRGRAVISRIRDPRRGDEYELETAYAGEPVRLYYAETYEDAAHLASLLAAFPRQENRRG